MDEAIADKTDVVISHHPLIFKGIKSIGGKSFTERIVSGNKERYCCLFSSY